MLDVSKQIKKRRVNKSGYVALYKELLFLCVLNIIHFYSRTQFCLSSLPRDLRAAHMLTMSRWMNVWKVSFNVIVINKSQGYFFYYWCNKPLNGLISYFNSMVYNISYFFFINIPKWSHWKHLTNLVISTVMAFCTEAIYSLGQWESFAMFFCIKNIK